MYGLVKVAAATPNTVVGDVGKNAAEIAKLIKEAKKRGVRLVVFPELALCGYTVGDLMFHSVLLDACECALKELAPLCVGSVAVVGLPLRLNGRIFNVAAVLGNGRILGVVPKKNLSNRKECNESRYFSVQSDSKSIMLAGEEIPFGEGLVFCDEREEGFSFGVEIGEDAWVANSPSIALTLGGARIICNPSASAETVGKAELRRTLLKAQSAKLVGGYIYADCGGGESTTDCVFAGHRIIAEDGELLAESRLLTQGLTVSDIDVEKIDYARRTAGTFEIKSENTRRTAFETKDDGKSERNYSSAPFIPKTGGREQTEFILSLQAAGLKRRMDAAKTDKLVVGISGGLDSALALIVATKAVKDAKNVTAVTMPCFGTGKRTLKNARKLSEALCVSFKEISIADSVKKHFEDIGHDINVKNSAYENAQARERTQILLDMANESGALVVGTGDLSESALGWTTYNGDHMSSYGVNASVPKTLVRFMVREYADICKGEAGEVLKDIAATEISPELLPPSDGKISQKTEDIIGKYEYHDFFIYHGLYEGCSPKKIMYLALKAFGEDKREEIKKAMKVFWSRFFSQQFKRSCMPDGAKAGIVSLSPRTDLKMPSDAVGELWLKETEEL